MFVSDRVTGRRSRILTVRQLFAASRSARIPDGRGYAWQLPEVARFLMEIEDAADSDDHEEPVYLGPVYGWRSDAGDLHVSDGVRRLMAITCFLAAARDRLPASGLRRRLERMLAPNRLFGVRAPVQGWLRVPDADRPWFEKRILAPGATLALPSAAEGAARSQLLAAARFIARALDDYSRDAIEERTLCLLDQATVCLALTPELGASPSRMLPPPVVAAQADAPLAPAFEPPADRDLLAWLTPAERRQLVGAQPDAVAEPAGVSAPMLASAEPDETRAL
jgi:hypothetical protein